LRNDCAPRNDAAARKRAAFLAVTSLVVVIVAGLIGCAKPQAAAPASPPVPVVVGKVVQKSMPIEVRAVGNVEAYSNVSLKAQVTGIVKSVHFREGQDVRKGELLFEIDKRPFEVALQQAEAALERDKAKAQNARLQAGRYAQLFEQGIVPRDQYDTIRAEADSQEAALRADIATIDNAKLNLQYCEIPSPIDGRTGSVLVYPGNLVKANDVPILVVINQVTPIYVNFAVPEQHLPVVKQYMAAGQLRVAAQVTDEPGAVETGSLTFIDNTVDTSTGTIRMKGTFANERRKLWPGQFVTVVMRLTSEPNAVVVPAPAINVGQNGQFVYVVGTDNTAQSRAVTTGRTVGNETIATSGVQPGETVVVDGQLRLSPGAKVEIKNPQASPPASQQASPQARP
jgi:multidrug efflux system membrane fusion protein